MAGELPVLAEFAHSPSILPGYADAPWNLTESFLASFLIPASFIQSGAAQAAVLFPPVQNPQSRHIAHTQAYLIAHPLTNEQSFFTADFNQSKIHD